MGSPEHRLGSAKVVLVGLNPGGDHAGEGIWDFDGNLAHVEERWGKNGAETPLQLQIHQWLKLLNLEASEVAHVNFVPFRSPDWVRLPLKAEALAFASSLWREVVKKTHASLFISFGKTVAWHISGLMGARRIAVLPVPWKGQSIELFESEDGKRIVAMPHPSRFTLMGRADDPDSPALFQIATRNDYSWNYGDG